MAIVSEAFSVLVIGGEYEGLETFSYVCAGVSVVFAIITLFGAVLAFSGRSWLGALIGSIFCLMSLWIALLPSILGIAACILILFGKEEFESKPPTYLTDKIRPGPPPETLPGPPPVPKYEPPPEPPLDEGPVYKYGDPPPKRPPTY